LSWVSRAVRVFGSLELLTSTGVEYVLVGGHAVGFHGYPRFTGEIDFLVRPTPANA